MAAYRYHAAIFVPGLPAPWHGCPRDWDPQHFPQRLEENLLRFIQVLCERFPCVFFSRDNGWENSMLWIGTPKDEEIAEKVSVQSRFVIGVHTASSIQDPFYEISLRCARGFLLENQAYIPLFLGVQPPERILRIMTQVHLVGEGKGDEATINELVFHIETAILGDSLDIPKERPPFLAAGFAPFMQQNQHKHLPNKQQQLLNEKRQLPKKYLYCMIGNTNSPAAVKFQTEMQACIEQRRESIAAYQGFWDWESQPGKDLLQNYDEIIKQSHFVIAVYQDSDGVPVSHKLESAFYYHLRQSLDGNVEKYIPILLSNMGLPIDMGIISSLDFYQDDMCGKHWKKLAKGICDNIDMLQIYPFQKFDYSLHRGTNLLSKAMLAQNKDDAILRLEEFITHTLEVTNMILNHLILETTFLKSKDDTTSQDNLKGVMKSRMDLFFSLFIQACDKFTSEINPDIVGSSCFDLLLNQYYKCIQLLLALIRKFSFLYQKLGTGDIFSQSIQRIAIDFMTDGNLEKIKLLRGVTKNTSFEHLKKIQHMTSEIEATLETASDDVQAAIQVITGMVNSCSKRNKSLYKPQLIWGTEHLSHNEYFRMKIRVQTILEVLQSSIKIYDVFPTEITDMLKSTITELQFLLMQSGTSDKLYTVVQMFMEDWIDLRNISVQMSTWHYTGDTPPRWVMCLTDLCDELIDLWPFPLEKKLVSLYEKERCVYSCPKVTATNKSTGRRFMALNDGFSTLTFFLNTSIFVNESKDAYKEVQRLIGSVKLLKEGKKFHHKQQNRKYQRDIKLHINPKMKKTSMAKVLKQPCRK